MHLTCNIILLYPHKDIMLGTRARMESVIPSALGSPRFGVMFDVCRGHQEIVYKPSSFSRCR